MWTRNTGVNPLLFHDMFYGFFYVHYCLKSTAGTSQSIRRTKQLWLSVLLKASVSFLYAQGYTRRDQPCRTHIAEPTFWQRQNSESDALDRSGTPKEIGLYFPLKQILHNRELLLHRKALLLN